MGACSSCLGRAQNESPEDESTRLLDDPNSMNYGGFPDNATNSLQGDPVDVQRENEALQKVVVNTSSHLVDIFAVMPQTSPRTPISTFSGQDLRVMQYQDVLAKLPSAKAEARGGSNGHELEAGHDWLSDDDEEDDPEPIKKPSEPILGGFTNVRSKVQ